MISRMAAPGRKRRRRSKYPDDLTGEVLEIIANGDVVLLNEVLQGISSIERACVLKATNINSSFLGYTSGDTACTKQLASLTVPVMF